MFVSFDSSRFGALAPDVMIFGDGAQGYTPKCTQLWHIDYFQL